MADPDVKRLRRAPTRCSNCGAGKQFLTWAVTVKPSTVSTGYPVAHLGCDHCSETLMTDIDPDVLIAVLEGKGT